MTELLEQMKLLNEDHTPDGYPAVKMSEINELIEIIEKKSDQLEKANEDYKTLFSAFESCQDELKESNERVKELEQFQQEIAYRCFLEGLNTEKPREPNAENVTATAINHFAVEVDRYARDSSRSILEQLRKEQE